MHRESNTSVERREKNAAKQKRPPMPMGLVGRSLGQGPEVLAFGSALRQYMPKDHKQEKRRQTLPEVSFSEVSYDEQYIPGMNTVNQQQVIPYSTMMHGGSIATFNPVETPWLINNGTNGMTSETGSLSQWQPGWAPLETGCLLPPQPSQFSYPHGLLRMPMFATTQPLNSQSVYNGSEYPYVATSYGSDYGMQINQEQSLLPDMTMVEQAPIQPVGTIGDDKKLNSISDPFSASGGLQELQCQLRNLQFHCEMIQQTMDQERRKLNGIRSACEGLVREMQAAGLEDNATVLMDALDNSIDQPHLNNCNANNQSEPQSEEENTSSED